MKLDLGEGLNLYDRARHALRYGFRIRLWDDIEDHFSTIFVENLAVALWDSLEDSLRSRK